MAIYKMKLEGETVNDTAIRNLKIGKHAYEIKEATMAVVKSDNTGKTQQVVIALEASDGYTCRLYLGVLSDNDQQREIAEKTLRGIAHAAGLTKGVLDLKKLVGNVVEITAVETVSKTDKTKKYVNVQLVEAYAGDEDEEEQEDEDEDEEEAPPAKPAKGKKPASKPEPEEEDEEEEEEEDEEEEDDEDEDEEEAPPAKAKKGGKKETPW